MEELKDNEKALELYQKIIELTESVGDETPTPEKPRSKMALWKANLLKWLFK